MGSIMAMRGRAGVHWIALVMVVAMMWSASLGDWVNELTLTSTSPFQGANFGRSVHTYSDFVIVGDNATRGSASIYIMPDMIWDEQAQLKPPMDEIGSFGFSVGLEASLAAVSAPHLTTIGSDYATLTDTFNRSANVYVYGRTVNIWSLQARFTSLQPGIDGFGYAVSMGGSYLAIGAPYAYSLSRGDGTGYGVRQYGPTGSILKDFTPSTDFYPPNVNNPKRLGAVYTYRKVNEEWLATGVLVPFMADDMDLFGWSVDISPDGSRMVVGSPGDVVDGTASGTTYVYTMNAEGTWDLETLLRASDEEPFDGFGYSVGVDASDVIVGTKTARAAYIFHKMADSWVQDAKLVGSDTQLNDGFGQSVSIFGTYAIVGAPLNMARGAAYLWEFDMKVGSWLQIRKFTASLPSAKLGSSVSIGARFMLAAAPSANHDIGHVLTLMLNGVPSETNPVDLSVQDVSVLIRFSGASTSMDLLLTRKILADAAGTGTAQTEVRIADLNTQSNSHLFGLQVRFTSSSTMSAGTAAQNLLSALPDIRYRLNSAVGAVSGTAEILPADPPIEKISKFTLEQAAAVIILILITILTTILTIYFTLQRRKKIAADKREFDALEAEKEAKRLQAEKDKAEKKQRPKRPAPVLRPQRRKDATYLQAENDAAGLEFTDTFFEMDDFPTSPRPYEDQSSHLDFDPTERIDAHGGDETRSMDDQDTHYDPSDPNHRTLELDDGPGLRLDDGPSIAMGGMEPKSSDGPRIGDLHHDGPKLNFDSDGPKITMDDGPKIMMDDGPKIEMDDGPKKSHRLDDGPKLMMDSPRADNMSTHHDGPSLQVGSPPDDGPRIDMGFSDGPSLGDERTQSNANNPFFLEGLSVDEDPTIGGVVSQEFESDEEGDSDDSSLGSVQKSSSSRKPEPASESGTLPTSSRKNPAVPRLNLSMGK